MPDSYARLLDRSLLPATPSHASVAGGTPVYYAHQHPPRRESRAMTRDHGPASTHKPEGRLLLGNALLQQFVLRLLLLEGTLQPPLERLLMP